MESYFSPSKLNLFFRVLRKRADGYHDIASLFQAIDLGDRLTLSPAAKDHLSSSDPNLPCDDSNLVMKALKLFRAGYSFPAVHIHLEKRVPMQSGLGGGSANAATALWALNQWALSPASLDDLCKMGAALGSDVAFFFSNGTAYCTGRGEIVEPMSIAPLTGYLAKPDFGLSTPLVYLETRIDELSPVDPRDVLQSYCKGQPRYFNDLEIAAFRIEPKLAILKKELLGSGFQIVSMTGSGTAFFCLGEARRPLPGIPLIPFCSIGRTALSWYADPSGIASGL
jgi:4-diphosphocytidyl-2-C-methyl-D-erythritol kinase